LRSAAPLARRLLALAALALTCAQAAQACPAAGDLPNSPATPDNLSAQQWNLTQIGAFQAQEITGGSPLVRVALIDSGIDPNHPEFAGRIDRENSVNCATGTAQTDTSGALWADDNGHGTFVAGIVAAGDNGFGIVGVAPNVQLVIVKVTSGQLITPAAVACAFDWVAEHDVDVANASLAVDKGPTANGDPLDFFCRSHEADEAAISLVGKAVKNARSAGVTIVASAGNNDLDMAKSATGGKCIRMPVQLPGVVAVSGEGRLGLRAASNPPGASNYGLGVIDVVAPGGDPAQGGLPGGLILSTFPSYIQLPPWVSPNIVDGPSGATYRYTAGTSFAAAHVSGVAALIVSRFGELRSPKNGKLRPGFVEARLRRTAEPKPCPADPRCEGGDENNGFFGHGEVDALAALSN
jgi:lantibiotic leader peptide-processing serine protease